MTDKPDNENWHGEFIAAFKANGSILRACQKLGVGRSTVYEHMDKDSAFAAQVREQREIVFDRVEEALVQRAIESDTTAAIFLLKSNRRSVYAERLELTGAAGGPVEIRAVKPQDQAAEVAAILAKAHQ